MRTTPEGNLAICKAETSNENIEQFPMTFNNVNQIFNWCSFPYKLITLSMDKMPGG